MSIGPCESIWKEISQEINIDPKKKTDAQESTRKKIQKIIKNWDLNQCGFFPGKDSMRKTLNDARHYAASASSPQKK